MSGVPSCSKMSSSMTSPASELAKMPKYVPSRGLTKRVREVSDMRMGPAVASIVLVRPVPMIDGVLTVDEAADREDGDHRDAVGAEEVAEREAEEAFRVEALGVERQHDDQHQKRHDAGQHLPLGVPPIRFALLALHHDRRSSPQPLRRPVSGGANHVHANSATHIWREARGLYLKAGFMLAFLRLSSGAGCPSTGQTVAIAEGAAMKEMWEEFRNFAMKGNVIDLAIGVIIGAAFTPIVATLVANIIMPVIGYVTAGVNFSNLTVTPVESVEIKYGLFLNAIIQFVITAIALFFLIKGISMVRKPAPAAAPGPSQSEIYLKEIRDALVKG